MDPRDKVLEPREPSKKTPFQISLAAVARRRQENSRKAALRHGVHLDLSRRLRQDATPRGSNEDEYESEEGASESSSESSTASEIPVMKRYPAASTGVPSLRLPAEIALLSEQPKAQSAPPALDRGGSGGTTWHSEVTLPPRCPTCQNDQCVVPFRVPNTWYCFGESRTGTRPNCATIWSDRLAAIIRWCPKCANSLDAEMHFGEFGYACRKCQRFYGYQTQGHISLTTVKRIRTATKSPYKSPKVRPAVDQVVQSINSDRY